MSSRQKAFTLLEITIVLGIIGLLAGFVLANYRGEEKRSALLRSTHQLAQDLRRVEEMAMSSQKTPAWCEQVEEGVFPKGGYGIHFVQNSDSYLLFADCDGEGDYDDWGSFDCDPNSDTPAGHGLGNSLNEIIEELTLEQGIKIKYLFTSGFPEDTLNALDITFTPPDPEVTIASGDDAWAEIVLCLKDNENILRTITINKAGLIDTD